MTPPALLSHPAISFLPFYREKLDTLNAAELSLATASSRPALHAQLVIILYSVYIEAYEHLIAGRNVAFRTSRRDLERCLKLLNVLNVLSVDDPPTLEKQVLQAASPAAPLKYTVLRAYVDMMNVASNKINEVEVAELLSETRLFLKEIEALDQENIKKQSRSDQIKEKLTAVNNSRRLWWTWGKNMWMSMMSILLNLELNATYAKKVKTAQEKLSPVMGLMSWILFLFRGGLEFSQAISEARDHSAALPEGMAIKKQGFGGRFSRQLLKRKFILLNDLITGTANALVFFWLKDPSWKTRLGASGSFLLLGVLVMDILLATWRYLESLDQHKKMISRLEAEMAQVQLGLAATPENTVLIAKAQLLQEAYQNEVFNWKYQERKFLNTVVFTLGLLIGYLAMNSFYSVALTQSIGLIGELSMMVAGAGLCFIVTLIYNWTNIMLERSKLLASADAREKEAQGFRTRMQTLTDENEKKGLYLQMQATLARSAFERECAAYQLKCAPLNTLLDTLVPIVFFLSFHFVSLGPAIGIFAGCVAIALAAKYLMKRWEPSKDKWEHKFFPTLEGDTASVLNAPSNEFDCSEATGFVSGLSRK